MFLNSIVLFNAPFEFYFPYIFTVVLFPIFLLRFRFPTQLVVYLLGPLLITGVVGVMTGDNTTTLFVKNFLNITVSSIFFYYICCLYEFDVKYLWKLYLRGAVFVAVVACIQYISYNIGFEAGYDYRWILNKWTVISSNEGAARLNSIFSEPSYYGSGMAPAFFVALYSLVRRETKYLRPWQSIIIIITYFLTFSSVAILGMFLSAFLLLVNFGFVRYAVAVIPVMIISFYLIYTNVNDFRERMDGVIQIYTSGISNSTEVHGSTFVQYNNFHIARENFIRNPLFGTGLGSHKIAFQKYSLTNQYLAIYEFNQADANSMGIRLMSETGLFGLLFMFIFIFKFFIRRNGDNSNEINWVISSSILVLILLQLFRQGNYTYNGFFLFMWLYYYNFSIGKKASETESQDEKEKLELESATN